MAHKLDKLYEGVPIYVISTGTSLRRFDFTRLNGRVTIGINRVVQYYYPSIVHFIDPSAHQHHVRALRYYNGMIIAGPGAGPTETHDNVFEVGRSTDTSEDGDFGPVGRSFSDGLFGRGGGCTALHAAILLGGNPIYLLGYDYYENNGRHFDEYDETRNDTNLYEGSFGGVEQLSRESWLPEIYNCNPRTRLKCFPHVDLETLPLRKFRYKLMKYPQTIDR